MDVPTAPNVPLKADSPVADAAAIVAPINGLFGATHSFIASACP
jgi:hypothetical protein